MTELPHEIDFGRIPFAIKQERPIFLYSADEASSGFIFQTPDPDTLLSPQSITLRPNESQQLILSIIPRSLGGFEKAVKIYKNGVFLQDLVIKAHIFNAQIAIAPENVKFQTTLITKSVQSQLTIANESESILTYTIMKSAAGDDVFDDDQFKIEPAEDKIYPTAVRHLTLTAIPRKAGSHEITAWIKCSGRQDRIPFSMNVQATAPSVDFDCDILDFGDIEINSMKRIDFNFLNDSPIQTDFHRLISPSNKSASLHLQFSQADGVVLPESSVPLSCTIFPSELGLFEDFIMFEVVGCQRPLALKVVARCIAPPVELKTDLDAVFVNVGEEVSMETLNFGIVAFGFGSTKEVHIFNRGCVKQQFEFKIQPGEKLNRSQQLLAATDFSISPQIIELLPGTSQSVSVTLSPAQDVLNGIYQDFFLNVFNPCQEKPLTSCELSAKVINASFQLEPLIYEIPEAFVGYQHQIEMQLKNVSPVIGRWLFPPQELNDQCIISSNQNSGVLNPGDTKKLTITMIPRCPGSIPVPVTFLNDSGDKQKLQCMVTYESFGPKMKPLQEQIKFSEIKTLDKSCKQFPIENIGLTEMFIRITAQKPGSFFTIPKEFQRFVLKANTKIDVPINYCANYPGTHKDVLLVLYELNNSACQISEDTAKQITVSQQIQLTGISKGTNLVCSDQDLLANENVECGTWFTTQLLSKELRIENHGPETQVLTWYPWATKNGPKGIISVVNNKQTLEPGQFCVFQFQCQSEKAIEKAKETFVLKSNVPGKQTDTAFTVNFHYQFIESSVKIYDDNNEQIVSKTTSIDFLYENFPIFCDETSFFKEEEVENKAKMIQNGFYKNAVLKRKIRIENTSSLGCNIQCLVKAPFSLYHDGADSVYNQFASFSLRPEEQNFVDLTIQLDEAEIIKNQMSKDVKGSLIIKLYPLSSVLKVSKNIPEMTLPLKATVRFPQVDFRLATPSQIIQYQNVNFDDYFVELTNSDDIDFGSAVPGTPVHRYIYVRNISDYPVQLNWQLANVLSDKFKFDITPSCIDSESGLLPRQIICFKCEFKCQAADSQSVRIDSVNAVCTLLGGPVQQFVLKVQISFLSVDVSPSHVNLGDVVYNQEYAAVLTLQNQSDVQAKVQLRSLVESMPFIRSVNEVKTQRCQASVWDYLLEGNQKMEITIKILPRIPGKLFVPIYVKSGHLEEVLVPITGNCVIENMQLSVLDQNGNEVVLKNAENIIAWKGPLQIPSMDALLIAAKLFIVHVNNNVMNYSTLERTIDSDGTLTVYNQTFVDDKTETVDQLKSNALYCQVANELAMTLVEAQRYFQGINSSRISSSAKQRDKIQKERDFENELIVVNTVTLNQFPKSAVIFDQVVELPPCQKNVQSEREIVVKNNGLVPISFNVERRFFTQFGLNIEPDKVSRLPPGESVRLRVVYVPPQEMGIGQHKYLVPIAMRSGCIGWLQVVTNIAAPTIQFTNIGQLAQNFKLLPVGKAPNYQILNFGECYFGRARKFVLRLSNPTEINSQFSCDLQNAAVGLYKIEEERQPANLVQKPQGRCDDAFAIDQNSFSILPGQEQGIEIVFKPEAVLEGLELGQSILFKGDLKFNIKVNGEIVQRLGVSLIGLGLYPQLSVSSQQIDLKPVFPKEIGQHVHKLEIVNHYNDNYEVYLKELDDIYPIETRILEALTQLKGKVEIQKKQKSVNKKFTLLINDFPAPGQFYSKQMLDQLQEIGYEKLIAFVKVKYGKILFSELDFNNYLQQMKEAREKVDKDKKKTTDQKEKGKGPSREQPRVQEQQQDENMVENSVPLLNLNLEQYQKQLIQSFKINCTQGDFSYDLSDVEQIIQSQKGSCPSIIDGRSFRISQTDNLVSNVPFLVYVIDGAPLSGKTTLGCKLQSQFKIHNKTIPIINLDNLLCNSQVFKNFKDNEAIAIQQYQELAAKAKGKNQPEPVIENSFMETEEYQNQLSKEIIQLIQQIFDNDQQFIQIGMIFDGLLCSYTKNVLNTGKIIFQVCTYFSKIAIYENQVLTSRLCIIPIILDILPLDARKRAMFEVTKEYDAARSALPDSVQNDEQKKVFEIMQQRMRLAKDALTITKQYYDDELKQVEANQNIQEQGDGQLQKQFTTPYKHIYCQQDVLGKRQFEFLQSVNLINEMLQFFSQSVFNYQKNIIDNSRPDSDKTEIEISYDTLMNQLKDTEAELMGAKKGPQQKQIQLKYDDIKKQIDQLIPNLPPHPVESVLKSNLSCELILQASDNDVTSNDTIFKQTFEESVFRFITALEKYQLVYNAIQSQKCPNVLVSEELFISKYTNCEPVDDVKIKLLDDESDLSQQLSGQISMIQQLVDSYIDSKNQEITNEKFLVFLANPFLIEYFDNLKAQIQQLQQETNVDEKTLKAMNKQQQTDIQAKKQQLISLQSECQNIFTGVNPEIEVGVSRWIIPANSSKTIYFRLYGSQIKKADFDVNLCTRFMDHSIPIKLTGLCDWPHVIDDMNYLVKPKLHNQHTFNVKESLIDFGYIKAGVPCPEVFVKSTTNEQLSHTKPGQQIQEFLKSKASSFCQLHLQTIDLENNSAFPTNIAIILDSQVLPTETKEQVFGKIWASENEIYAEEVDPKKSKAPAKGKDVVQIPVSPFYVYPNKVKLEPGQKLTVFVCAFPTAEQTAQMNQQLFVATQFNPKLLTYKLQCQGVVPSTEITVPSCIDDLIPAGHLVNDIQNFLAVAVGGQVIDPKKKKDPKKQEPVKMNPVNCLQMPRVSLKQRQVVEVKVRNPCKMPIKVEYLEMVLDQSTKEVEDVLDLRNANRAFKIVEEKPPKTEAAKNLPSLFSLTNEFVTIRNTKFVLKPESEQTITFSFASSAPVVFNYLGYLAVTLQPPTANEVCSVAELQAFANQYVAPIHKQPLIICAEAYNIDVQVGVTKIVESPEHIMQLPSEYALDKQHACFEFGVCKAVTHFQGELQVANKGLYPIKYLMKVAPQYKQLVNFIKQEEIDPKATKGKGKEAVQPNIIYLQEMSGIIAEAEQQQVNEKDKKGKEAKKDPKAPAQLANLVSFNVDFFAESRDTMLSNAPVISITFSDPTTDKILSRSVITLSAVVKYAELKLSPDKLMNFGDLCAGRETVRNVCLENIGAFPCTIVFEKLTTVIKRFIVTGCLTPFDDKYDKIVAGIPPADVVKLQQANFLGENIQTILAPNSKDKKPNPKDKNPINTSTLVADGFQISPYCFFLKPKEKQVVSVKFSAKGNKLFKDIFVINYSNRFLNLSTTISVPDAMLDQIESQIVNDYKVLGDQLGAQYKFEKQMLNNLYQQPLVGYTIVGNSQLPIISTKPEDLFEEQTIVNQAVADPTLLLTGSQYSLFGNQLCIGPVQLGTMKQERVKIFNPTSVELNVAYILTSRQDPVQLLFDELIGDSCAKVLAFIDQCQKPETARPDTKSKGASKTTAPKPAKGKGPQLDVASNDDEAWVLDKLFDKIVPHGTQYVTIKYKPTLQNISNMRFIAVLLDNWLRLDEELKRDPVKQKDKGGEKALMSQLLEQFSQDDIKNQQVSFSVSAVGVLPEIQVSPQMIDLGKVYLQAQVSSQQTIRIKNTGRVSAEVSVLVQGQTIAIQDCFELIQIGKGPIPANKLFSGLLKIGSEETIEIAVQPSIHGISILNGLINADITIRVILSESEFNSINIPIVLNVISNPVCVIQDIVIKHNFFNEVLSLLFNVPQSQNQKQICQTIFNSLPDSQAVSQQRNLFLQQLNAQIDQIGYKQVIVLNDSVPSSINTTTITLINQSQVVQRFNFEECVLQKLNISAQPTCGHILPGGQQAIQIIMNMPTQEIDPKAKKGTVPLNRNLLFGNPLLIQTCPIQLHNTRKGFQWDNTQTQIVFSTDSNGNQSKQTIKKEEPHYDRQINQQRQKQLQDELNELMAAQGKKQKLNPQQQYQLITLSKANEGDGIILKLMASATFVEINLFGTLAPQVIKPAHVLNDAATVLGQEVINDSMTKFKINIQQIPILQEAVVTLKLINEGLSSSALKFSNSSNSSSPFTVELSGELLPRPDLFAAAIKETYPNISDIPSLSQYLTKNGISQKGVDKNAAQASSAKYSAYFNNQFASSLTFFFRPKVQGQFEEIFEATNYQFHLASSASLSLCHIEAQSSQYLSSSRPSSYPTPAFFVNYFASSPKSVKVLEISGIGAGKEAIESISFTNTVDQSYKLQLIQFEESSKNIKCLFSNCVANEGEKIVMRFAYLPTKDSMLKNSEEAFFVLKIVDFDISIPILIVGRPQEPRISLINTKAFFGQLNYKQQKTIDVVLKNEESISYNFSVRPVPFSQCQVKIAPMQGIIPPNGITTLQYTCMPNVEGIVSYSALIDVSSKSVPLQSNIKYECAKQKFVVELLAEQEELEPPIVVGAISELDFGSVYVSDIKQRKVKITNVGIVPLDYQFDLKLRRIVSTQRRDSMDIVDVNKSLRFVNQAGTIEPGLSSVTTIAFTPKQELLFNQQYGVIMNLDLAGIEKKQFHVQAKSIRPGLHSNVQNIDFGHVLCGIDPVNCKVRSIKLSNMDKNPLIIEYITDSNDFCIISPPLTDPMQPGESVEVQIRFQPQYANDFTDYLKVTVNGMYSLKYQLSGVAVQQNLVFKQKQIPIGSVQVNHQCAKFITIENRSMADQYVNVMYHPDQDIPHGLFIALVSQDKSQDFGNRALERLIEWNQRKNKQVWLNGLSHEILVQAGEIINLFALYAPFERRENFSIQLDFKLDKFFLLQNCCQIIGQGIGINARILNPSVELAPCLQNSSVKQQFFIENKGDVALEFNIPIPPKAIIKKYLINLFEKQIIQFNQTSGIINPGQSLPITVTFKPPQDFKSGHYLLENIAINYTFQEKQFQLGTINILAISESKDDFVIVAEQTIKFVCKTRETEIKQLQVDNSTDKQFEVRSIFEGAGRRQYDVPDRLLVPPGGIKFNVTYHPFSQTKDNEPHNAKLIIASPEGGAYVYNFEGNATAPQLDGFITNVSDAATSNATQKLPANKQPPKPKSAKKDKDPQPSVDPRTLTQNIVQYPDTIMAYQQASINVKLHNWEQQLQRFYISHSFTNPIQQQQCVFGYPEFIDVPSLGQRDVTLQFLSYNNDMIFEGELIFENKQSHEYLKYKFLLSSKGSVPLLQLVLGTTVRDKTSQQMQLPNMFMKIKGLRSVSLTPTADRPDISFEPLSLDINGQVLSAIFKSTLAPQIPFDMTEETINVNVKYKLESGEEVTLSPAQVKFRITSQVPRPSSPMRVQADQNKAMSFSVALKNGVNVKSNVFVSLAENDNIQLIFDQISKSQPATKGKDISVADGKTFFMNKNSFSIDKGEISVEASANFVVPVVYNPSQIGDSKAYLVVYGKQIGFWVIPLIGTCKKLPASGTIGFE